MCNFESFIGVFNNVSVQIHSQMSNLMNQARLKVLKARDDMIKVWWMMILTFYSLYIYIGLEEIHLFFIFLMWLFAGSPKRRKATAGQHCQRPKSVPNTAGGAGVTGQLMVLLAMLAFFFSFFFLQFLK